MLQFLANILSASGETLSEISSPLSSQHSRVLIKDGEAGTAETIRLMQQIVAKGKRDNAVREVVGKILSGEIPGLPLCTQKDYRCYAEAIFLYCRDQIKYAYDPHLVEYLEHPAVLLKNKIGDCDSKCILMASMFEQIGFQTQFATVKADPQRPQEFSHVYCRVQIPRKGWYAVDATMPGKPFGWEPPEFFGRKYWHGSTDMIRYPVDSSPSLDSTLSGGNQMSGIEEATGSCPEAGMNGWFDWLTGGGEEPTTEQKATVANIVNGSLRAEIQRMWNKDMADSKRLEAVFNQIQRMPEGNAKTEAKLAYDKANAGLLERYRVIRKIKDDYNNAVVEIQAKSAVKISPLAGLGWIPVVVAGVAITAALALLASQISNGISAWNGHEVNTEGYIGQAARLAQSVANVIQQGGETTQKVTDSFAKFALIAAAGVGLFYAVKNKEKLLGVFKRG
jgi:hypothetical protein